jgi:nitrogen-specific signal transduction histidine kinase
MSVFYTHFYPHYRKESHMNKADIDRLIAVEADRIRACTNRLIELYPPQPTDDHSLEAHIAKDKTGALTADSLGLALEEIERLLDIARDYADLIK